jgi:2'-5' RNA ligase
MEHLLARYNALREAATRQLAEGTAELDAWLDSPQDTRRGLTLLARPPAHLTAAIGEMLADFRLLEPDQYYYPASDMHLTILSIISCYPAFTLDLIDPSAYRQAVRAITQTSEPFTITYAGLTASPGTIMVQGFPDGPGLERLRAATRAHFQSSGLQQSIDLRYSIQTAHATVLRFRRPLRNPARLLEKLAQYQHQFIGSFAVNSVELVYNDWYQRARNTVLLEEFQLGTSPENSLSTSP